MIKVSNFNNITREKLTCALKPHVKEIKMKLKK